MRHRGPAGPAGLFTDIPSFELDTDSQHFNSPTSPSSDRSLRVPRRRIAHNWSPHRLHPNRKPTRLSYPIRRNPRIHEPISPHSSIHLRRDRYLSVPGPTFGVMSSRPRRSARHFLLRWTGYNQPPSTSDPRGVLNIQVYYCGNATAGSTIFAKSLECPFACSPVDPKPRKSLCCTSGGV